MSLEILRQKIEAKRLRTEALELGLCPECGEELTETWEGRIREIDEGGGLFKAASSKRYRDVYVHRVCSSGEDHPTHPPYHRSVDEIT